LGSIDKIVGISGKKAEADRKQKEIEEDKLKNTLTDNIAPHYWGKDRLIARIRLL
jgi:hypothetical protein